mgnify:CR=1 FL=1
MADFTMDRFSLKGKTALVTGAERGIGVAVSATKTFNIAGLKHSTFLLPDPQMREMVKKKADEIGMGGGGQLKKVVTEAVNGRFAEIRERREELLRDPDYIRDVLADGNKRANEIAHETLNQVREAMGMVY